ncbi:gliding motility-associated C-terminal domain-containing protein [Emticicia agri]|uniref:T9SS type B sorting domain-containing protein n=1 Tax=Emticicia agri TaxID=2492393 RepID=A0A4Q5LXU6_9BACT|nr:gliding motility-associated C-terminal domain-containing protein [Emticicia agri]RYU94469.1 T9SS type B sorting domain-containing protein [Emticicia agri]
MKYFYFFCFFIVAVAESNAAPDKSVKFIRNEGQWEASVLFKAEIPGGYLLVKRTGLQYVFFDTKALAALHGGGIKDDKGARVAPGPIKGHAFEMTFQEANASPKIETAGKSETVYNFFIGNDQSKWRGNVSAYDEIYLKDIYPDIDFKLYSFDQSLKYEYIVKPKADVSKIRMKYVGLDELSIQHKKLSYRTSVNTVTEFEPYSFQVIGGKTRDVQSGFRLKNNEVQFEFPENYESSQPLTIDPELVFSTYSGSKSDNWAQTATYDADGNLFAGGSVFGGEFPVTNGAFQVNADPGSMPNGMNNVKGYGITDVVIMKFAGTGSQLIYATYLGGDASDVPHSLIANSKGELVIFGTTASSNFPTTNASYQNRHAGGSLFGVYGSVSTADEDPNFTGIGFERGSDIFVAVLSTDGKKLVGSTYIGGRANDGFNDTRALIIKNYGDEFRGEVVVDKDDNIYFASITASTDFPVVKASQPTKGAGYDAVICKLNPTCSQLLWSTYLGGNNFEGAYGIKVDDAGKVYVCGQTFSANLSTTSGVHGKTYSGSGDGFIAKFSASGVKEQLTYMGTEEADANFFLEIDTEDNVYVFGLTQGDYPVSGDVYSNANSGQFVHCLDKNLSKTIFSTVVGASRGRGRIDIVPTAFLVNDCGNIYLAGWGGKVNSSATKNLNRFSTTTGLPVTQDAYQATTTGSNFYLMILEKNAKSLLYATFFGSAAPKDASGEVGDHVDGGTCRFDKHGYIYHSACACLSRGEDQIATFPIKNAWQPKHQSTNCNMAAFKFEIDALKADFEIKNEANRLITEVCAPAKINFYDLSKGAKTYEWVINEKVITRTKDMLLYNFTTPGTYTIKLRIFNKITCRVTDSTVKTFLVKGFVAKASGDTLVCPNSPVQLMAEGGEKYTWSPSASLNNAGIANPVATPQSTTEYNVVIEKEGCTVNKEVTVKVEDNKPDFLANGGKEICAGESVELKATGYGTKFTWSGPGIQNSSGTSITVTPKQTSIYTVTCEYPDGCKPTRTVTVKIDDSFKPDFDYSITQDCTKPYELTFTNKTQNAAEFKWGMGNADTLSGLIPQSYRYSKGGTFQVTLKAYNKIGCELSVTKNIDIPENEGKVPNVITPNNDGKNDNFVTGFKDVTIDIYNRYGKLIYASKDYQNDWGKDIPSGTYYYIFSTPSGSNCKGWVTVID